MEKQLLLPFPDWELPAAIAELTTLPPDETAWPSSQGGTDSLPTESMAETAIAPGVREQIVQRFEIWLDEILSQPEPPSGLAAELLAKLQNSDSSEDTTTNAAGSDLYSLWSAVIALTQETRLQGRAFRQLGETLSPVQDMVQPLQSLLNRHEELLDERCREMINEARHKGQCDVGNALLDMRDRLMRGLTDAQKHLGQMRNMTPSGLLGRFIGKSFQKSIEAAEALIKGYVLSIARLDESVHQLGIHEIDCIGRLFDPQCMNAVDVEERADMPDATVIDVYQPGYIWNETVHRPAQVKVSRRPAQENDEMSLCEELQYERE
jgi:molecular chaperone GrpE